MINRFQTLLSALRRPYETGLEMLKKAKLPQDDEKRAEKEIQKMHDEGVKKITSFVAAKEKNIMSGK